MSDDMRIFKGGKNIVSMSGFKDQSGYQPIKQLEAYWEGLRMGRLVPQRSEIDPRGIDRALEYTFILERIAPGLARFRLSGMHLNDLLGMEVRGMPFTSFFTPAARDQVTAALEQVFDGPQMMEMTLMAERSIGKPRLEGRLILLPLRSDLGEITRILGAFVTLGPIGRAPRRFDVLGIKRKGLEAGHMPNTLAEQPQPAPLKARDPIAKEKGPDGKRPALRLVVSNDLD